MYKCRSWVASYYSMRKWTSFKYLMVKRKYKRSNTKDVQSLQNTQRTERNNRLQLAVAIFDLLFSTGCYCRFSNHLLSTTFYFMIGLRKLELLRGLCVCMCVFCCNLSTWQGDWTSAPSQNKLGGKKHYLVWLLLTFSYFTNMY